MPSNEPLIQRIPHLFTMPIATLKGNKTGRISRTTISTAVYDTPHQLSKSYIKVQGVSHSCKKKVTACFMISCWKSYHILALFSCHLWWIRVRGRVTSVQENTAKIQYTNTYYFSAGKNHIIFPIVVKDGIWVKRLTIVDFTLALLRLPVGYFFNITNFGNKIPTLH